MSRLPLTACLRNTCKEKVLSQYALYGYEKDPCNITQKILKTLKKHENG